LFLPHNHSLCSGLSQTTDLQRDALLQACVDEQHLYEDYASGKNDKRAGLEACLKALREGDVLVVWKLDRLARSLNDLVHLVRSLEQKGVHIEAVDGSINTNTLNGQLVFHIFAALAEFEKGLIQERTRDGLHAARARGRVGGRKPKLSAQDKKRLQELIKDPKMQIHDLKRMFGVSKSTLYRYAEPSETNPVESSP
jgi:DNA invertase Pin-like site-specific DNA recombinase